MLSRPTFLKHLTGLVALTPFVTWPTPKPTNPQPTITKEQAMAVLGLTEADFTTESYEDEAPYPDPERTAILDAHLAKIKALMGALIGHQGNIEYVRSQAPQDVDAGLMVGYERWLRNEIDEFCATLDSFDLAQVIEAATGTHYAVPYIKQDMANPDDNITYEQWLEEIHAIRGDDPQAADELTRHLNDCHRHGLVPNADPRRYDPEVLARHDLIWRWQSKLHAISRTISNWSSMLCRDGVLPPEDVDALPHYEAADEVLDQANFLAEMVDCCTEDFNLDELLTTLSGQPLQSIFDRIEAKSGGAS